MLATFLEAPEIRITLDTPTTVTPSGAQLPNSQNENDSHFSERASVRQAPVAEAAGDFGPPV